MTWNRAAFPNSNRNFRHLKIVYVLSLERTPPMLACKARLCKECVNLEHLLSRLRSSLYTASHRMACLDVCLASTLLLVHFLLLTFPHTKRATTHVFYFIHSIHRFKQACVQGRHSDCFPWLHGKSVLYQLQSYSSQREQLL